jgi:formiminotetrahydrofolate cyclodeaminase
MPVLANQTLRRLIDDLAARTPSPGGGATAAVAGALGAAQLLMVAEYASWPDGDDPRHVLRTAIDDLLDLADEDAAAYAAYRAGPKDDGVARERIRAVPRKTIEAASEALATAERIESASKSWFGVDIAIAISCLSACRDGAQRLAEANG